MLSVGSLFAGGGGWDLGLERAGMRVLWQCEIDPDAQRVLAKHWPDVLRVSDIRGVDPAELEHVDVIAGSFPCQGVSPGGKRLGLADPRSGLWSEMFRIVRHVRPSYVLVENSGDLAVRGLDRVLGDLASEGFDAEWEELPACAFGASHTRRRLFVVAYPDGERRGRERGRVRSAAEGQGRWDVYPWDTPAGDLRVAHGIPAALVRNRIIGNAVVPAIAEHIGRRILEWEGLT